jgi:two-component system chemotaxis response regulator CheB
MAGAGKLNVLVVDDSAVVRQTLTAILAQEPDMSVTAAADPIIAQGKIARERPDVIVLDLEMPRMDGLTFLRTLMASDAIPVVICSGLTGAGAAHAMRALEEGAVSIVTKPRMAVREFLYESAVILVDAVRAAAAARLPLRWGKNGGRGVAAPRALPPARRPAPVPGSLASDPGTVIAIGASVGGTDALRLVLGAFPADAPGTVVVQHMPETFTAAFAAHLDAACPVSVREAADGDPVRPGQVLIAPGNRHLSLRRSGTGFAVEIGMGPLVSRHRPSVDVLFQSVARAAGPRAVGALLTGMGDDGADGLLAMRREGAHTIAQDEATCVVFGMPREAIARGAAREVVPLGGLAGAILEAARSGVR